MKRISSALLGAVLTISLVPATACVGDMDEGSVDPVAEVGTESEAMKLPESRDPAGEVVLEQRAIKQVDDKGNEQQNFVATPSYTASGTNNATVNTVNYSVSLNAGETLTIGTWGLAGAASYGNTFLRLYNQVGTEVAANDDVWGVASQIVFTAPSTGYYQLHAGCSGNLWCSGTLAYGFSAPLISYNASNTASATMNTANISLNIGSFSAMKLGTCAVPGSSGSGDTYLRLYNSSNMLVASNDDACGTLSHIAIAGGTLPPGIYSLRAGCYGNSACSGTIAYSVE